MKSEGCVCRTAAALIKRLGVSYARDGANYHKSYHYYTTLSGLAYMMITHKLRLTNIRSPKLNDLKEPREFGAKEVWNRLCIACFSTLSEDSNPMWGLYGIPEDEAICITIPAGIMKKICEEGRCYVENGAIKFDWNDADRAQKVAESFTPLKGRTKLTHHDVAYFPNLYRDKKDDSIVLKLYRREDCIAELDLSVSGNEALKKLVGYVKRKEWSYEDESRLHLVIPSQYGKKNVYVELPSDFFREVRITLGPCFDVTKRNLASLPSASAKAVLDRFLRQKSDERIFSSIKTSGYLGLLQYRTVSKNQKNTKKSKTKSQARAKGSSAKKQVGYKFLGKRVIRECRSSQSISRQLFTLKGK